ncbi:ribonuclease H-like protein [Gyrodon lividus]|nr:ribonuclease H-like protein [Gyrodon lividus]
MSKSVSSSQIATASSNWLALQKVLPQGSKKQFPPRKRRKIDGEASTAPTSSSMFTTFPRGASSAPSIRSKHNTNNEELDLDTTETKNGESIAELRKMILGKVEYRSSQVVPGKYLAIDCEMVGVGIDGAESSLARVSIVNYAGAVILDVFVRQRERVIDYRTQWSGVRRDDLGGGAKSFDEVQKTVAELIKDSILVGHAVYNDLKALLLSHPSPQLRDTQSLAFKHRLVKSRRPALRVLVQQELAVTIQGGEHSSVTDARATMALFRLYKKQWESRLRPLQSKSKGESKSALGAKLASGSSPAPEQPSVRGEKRKRTDHESASGSLIPQPSSRSPSPSNTRVPPSSPTRAQSPTLHLATLSKPPKQKRDSDPAPDPVTRKGVSSGLSIVVRRAGEGKDVKGKGLRGSTSGKAGRSRKMGTGSDGEKWWTSLGGNGGKKGSIRV